MAKRLKTFLLVIGLLLSLIATSTVELTKAQTSSEETVSVVLHKLLFDDSMPSQKQNDGKGMPKFDAPGRPFDGVTFTAYDITDVFWEYHQTHGKASIERAQQHFSKEGPGMKKPLESHTTKNGGVAEFPALPLRSGSHYAVYLFKETGTPKGIDGQSQNLVLVLPANDSGRLQRRIDLYPKNRLFDENQTITKSVAGNGLNFDFGASISYVIRVRIPADIGALTSFSLGDTADPRLSRIGEPTVSVDGRDVTKRPDFYTMKQANKNGFMIDFGISALTSYAGKLITVRYKMVIGQQAQADEPLVNTAVLYPSDGDPIIDRAIVQTGGKRFVKVDATNRSRKLQGATFVVSNEAGKYLVDGPEGWSWRSVGSDVVSRYKEAHLHQLTSDVNGHFSIQGLARGCYQLVEVKAPKGYSRNKEAIPFTIMPGTFSAERAAPYVVVNVREPKTPPDNVFSRYFPKTGEARAVWLSLIGALVLVTVFWSRKNNY